MAVRRNRIKIQPYLDGDSKTHNLITLKKLKAIVLSFVGVLTVTGGTTNGTLVQDGLLRTVLNILRMSVNGRRPIDVDGVLPYWYRAVLSGSAGVLQNPAVTVGANACRFNVVLDMDQLRTAVRAAGRMNMDIQDQSFLEIQTGAAEGGIVAGGDRVEVLTGNLEIIGLYDDTEYRGGHRMLSKDRYVISGATQDGRIIIPSGQLLAGILLIATDDGVRDQAIVNRIKIQVGEDDIRRDVSWQALQESNVEDYGLELVSGLPPYAGVAYINLDPDGDMNPAKILDTRKLVSNSARLTLDVNAPTGVSHVDVLFVGVSQKNRP